MGQLLVEQAVHLLGVGSQSHSWGLFRETGSAGQCSPPGSAEPYTAAEDGAADQQVGLPLGHDPVRVYLQLGGVSNCLCNANWKEKGFQGEHGDQLEILQ